MIGSPGGSTAATAASPGASPCAAPAAGSTAAPPSAIDALPDALLEAILLQLDAHTLLQRVALVSRRFRRVAEGQTLWRVRLPPELAAVLAANPADAPHGQPLAVPLHRLWCALASANLLRNPWLSLEGQMEDRRTRGADRTPGRAEPPWRVPAGSNRWGWGPSARDGLLTPPGEAPLPPPPLPPYAPQPVWREAGVLASSYTWNGIMQEVDLVDELRLRGLSRSAACAFLDEGRPTLELTFYVAGRFDCQGWCEAHLVLDNRADPVPAHRYAFLEWAEQAPMTARLPQNDVELNVWRPRSLRATVTASGVRRALVLLAGSEHRFWAGEYGCKFAAPVLRFEVQGLRPSAGSGQP
ncbi:hypothetical protein ABPG77_003909 [Micractinium sp. CCAP 211/92]